MIDVIIASAMDSNKIRLPISEVLLRAAAGDLARSKKQSYWTPLNAVLMEAEILDGETSAEYLLKKFSRTVMERATGEEEYNGDEGDEENKVEEIEKETKKKTEKE